MTDDLYVSERSRDLIRELALATRGVLGFANEYAPDILLALENELTRRLPHFAILPVANGTLGPMRLARASYNPPKIEIENDWYKLLATQDAQARFDVSHELGHLILHYDGVGSLPKYRTEGNVVFVKSASMSAERQADAFATEFLVPQHIARLFSSADEIVEWCKVPLSCAELAPVSTGHPA